MKARKTDFRRQPQAVVDLHGQSLAAAEESVAMAIEQARQKNYRLLRIITGQGQILSPWLRRYLDERALVWRPAGTDAGGLGAIDILF